MEKQQSKHSPKMGASFNKSGVDFRVWAPSADKVYVTGDFNDWSKRHPLQRNDAGIWEGNAREAKANDEYKYIIVNGDQELERVDPYARHVTNSVGNGIIECDEYEWQHDEFTMPALNEMVIYELHVGTFRDDPGGPPGNFESVIEKLPYLQELGINTIQIMPPLEFPGGFSWGYNPSHLFAIESDYGGPTAFKQLVDAAHEKGIAVIVDVVYNHFGPSDLDLWQFDGWSENGGGGIYFYNDWRGETPWGATRPDYGRGEVRQFIIDNVRMWLEEYHVDGLRFDATSYIRNIFGNNNDPDNDLPDGWSLLGEINHLVHSYDRAYYTIAEDLQQNPYMTKEPDEGGAGFDAQWASSFVHPIRQAMTATEDAARDLNTVADAISKKYNNDAFDRVIYTESHDEVANGKARLPEDIHPASADSWFAKKRSMLGAGLVFTSPGVPMIFQGQEFLEDEWFRDQTPLDWERAEMFPGIVQYYRDLIHLRLNRQGMTRGLTGQHVDMYYIDNDQKVMAFARWEEGDEEHKVIILTNFSDRTYTDHEIGLPTAGTWHLRLNSDAQVYDESFGNEARATVETTERDLHQQAHAATFTLPPYTLLIYTQE